MIINEKYYIEFVGAHGAGKTYTYHVIAKQQLLKPYISLYPGQVKRPKLHFALSCPIILVKNIKNLIFVVKFFFNNAQINLINFKVLRSLLKMIILHPYYFQFNFNFLLKDDMLHMLQRISFKTNVNVENVFYQYFTRFSFLYNGLIFVDISSQIMRERFKKRFPGKNEYFKESRRIIHERVKKQSVELRKVITTQTKVPYLIIDGSEDVNKNVKKIISFVKNKIILNKEKC